MSELHRRLVATHWDRPARPRLPRAARLLQREEHADCLRMLPRSREMFDDELPSLMKSWIVPFGIFVTAWRPTNSAKPPRWMKSYCISAVPSSCEARAGMGRVSRQKTPGVGDVAATDRGERVHGRKTCRGHSRRIGARGRPQHAARSKRLAAARCLSRYLVHRFCQLCHL